jgi:hypothetical protein
MIIALHLDQQARARHRPDRVLALGTHKYSWRHDLAAIREDRSGKPVVIDVGKTSPQNSCLPTCFVAAYANQKFTLGAAAWPFRAITWA